MSDPSPFQPCVGAKYDPALVARMTPEQLLTRPILDPQFADNVQGTSYDWRSDFRVWMDDPAYQSIAEILLDSLSSASQGRQMLRQAAAMHRLRQERGETTNTGPLIVRQGTDGEFSEDDGMIILGLDNIARTEYLGVDREFHNVTLGHLLCHELGHAADTIFTRDNKPFRDALRERTRAASNATDPAERALANYDLSEASVINATNPLVAEQGFGMPRDPSYETRRRSIESNPDCALANPPGLRLPDSFRNICR
jgi:hypothetical protein